jgi:murein L,D-transpeptidase YcbB/YkuD
MTEALARLMFHVMFGKVDPTAFDPQWNFARTVHQNDPAAFLQDLIASGDVLAGVEREKPRFEMYADLREALARYRGIEARGGWPGLATGPTLRVGTRDARVIALRSRLAAEGELEAGQVSDGDLFDPTLEAALRSFQARHGLATDGALGPETLAELNVPVADRITQIRVNLERGRWLLHELDPTFVVVNVAGFQVYYIRDRQLAWTAHAVVGKPFRKTPLFRERIQYLVFNPTWTVPPGILSKDILPAVRRDPGYLEHKRIDVVDRAGRVVPVAAVDWNARTISYQLVQRPGADNSLGVVKFMFPNPYSVYLHDTPSKELFQEADRAFSSGCIRVERPLELAELLLQGQPGWDRAGIDAVVERGTTRTVTLAKPVPVLLTYWTAWVEASGTLQFRKDVYRRDAAVVQALANRFDAHAAERRVKAALAQ